MRRAGIKQNSVTDVEKTYDELIYNIRDGIILGLHARKLYKNCYIEYLLPQVRIEFLIIYEVGIADLNVLEACCS